MGGLSLNATSRGALVPAVVKNFDPYMMPLVVGDWDWFTELENAPVAVVSLVTTEVPGFEPK
jgi:hypothetical protein